MRLGVGGRKTRRKISCEETTQISSPEGRPKRERVVDTHDPICDPKEMVMDDQMPRSEQAC